MARHNWKRFRPTSLRDAIEGCVKFANDRHNRSVEQIAERCGIASKFTLYKYIESGKLPAILIRPFECACGCEFVTAYLAHSAHKLIIDIPTGRKASEVDVLAVQRACNEAVNALAEFVSGKAEAPEVLASINDGLEHLAFHRTNVEKAAQPELEFGA